MRAQMDVICCKSVGTDLSMLDIEDFITEICQLKKEVASLEAKLRERGDKPNREDLEKVSVCVTDGAEAQDSVWSSRDTQDSKQSYTDAQDHGSADQTSDCNAGEQQMKMCSVQLEDCRNLIERRGEETTAEEQQQEEEEDEDQNNDNVDDDKYFDPSDDNAISSSDGETASTSKQRQTVTDCGKTSRRKRKHTEQKDFTCKICDISFSTSQEKRRHSKEHKKKEFHCDQCGKNFNSSSNFYRHKATHKDREEK
ncbi:hypothetical protein R3I93_005627 [Phoxinus phoxinus]|uniref:C2H2-type domain-containing protein n=1 Tax=Phoxinus phoxinus TaxID=58324 RepID=A0AAN9HAT7_9TELE